MKVMTQMYPNIKIERNKKPNRWYAIPLLGIFVKLILVIPVGIELWFLGMIQFLFSILNSLNIFFRGRYWKMAYDLNLGMMQLQTNVAFFLFGLTDTYPGFSLKTTDYQLTMDFNKTPSRVLATPLLGVLFRFVLMIPYLIVRQVIALAAFLAILVGWIWVLFSGTYPETVYEIARDSVRVEQAATMYFFGMSDSYPSWWISLKHKTLKIILLVLAIAFFLLTFVGRPSFWGNRTRMHYQMPTARSIPMQYTY